MNESHETQPHIMYRLYAIPASQGAIIVPILNDDESCYDSTRFVGAALYTYACAQRALFGYRLMQGDMLLPHECVALMQLLK